MCRLQMSPAKLLVGLTICALLLVTFSAASAEAACKLGESCSQTAKEVELGLKLMMSKFKIRKEPLARANNERLLKKSLQKRRKLMREIEELESSIAALTRPSRKNSIGGSSGAPDEERTRQAGQRVKFTNLTKREVQARREQLEVKRRQLAQLRVTIKEAQNIVAHPEQYVRVPSNYGARSPESVQDEERDLLVKDLENMHRRDQIRRGAIPEPLVLSDRWD